MRNLVDILLSSVSGTVATMNMASKPLLGFARAEVGGFEVATMALKCSPIVWQCGSNLLLLDGLCSMYWLIIHLLLLGRLCSVYWLNITVLILDRLGSLHFLRNSLLLLDRLGNMYWLNVNLLLLDELCSVY